MKDVRHKLLISVVGYGATWQGAAHDIPWSIYMTRDGQPVLQGGPYPDETASAQLLIDNLKMNDAFSTAKRLEALLSDLGIDCQVEELGDL